MKTFLIRLLWIYAFLVLWGAAADFASAAVACVLAGVGVGLLFHWRAIRGTAFALVGLVLIVHLRWCVLDWAIVDGLSMEPALRPAEIVFVRKTGILPPVTPFLHEMQLMRLLPLPLKHGQVVVIRYPGLDGPGISRVVKRIAALPGDEYEFKESAYFLNGQKVAGIESTTRIQPPPAHPPEAVVRLGTLAEYSAAHGVPARGTVPQDSVLVLGDNSAESRDSRSIGFIPVSLIEGEVLNTASGGTHVPNAQ